MRNIQFKDLALNEPLLVLNYDRNYKDTDGKYVLKRVTLLNLQGDILLETVRDGEKFFQKLDKRFDPHRNSRKYHWKVGEKFKKSDYVGWRGPMYKVKSGK